MNTAAAHAVLKLSSASRPRPYKNVTYWKRRNWTSRALGGRSAFELQPYEIKTFKIR